MLIHICTTLSLSVLAWVLFKRNSKQTITFSGRSCSPHGHSNLSLSGSSAIVTLFISHPHGQGGWASQWPRSTLTFVTARWQEGPTFLWQHSVKQSCIQLCENNFRITFSLLPSQSIKHLMLSWSGGLVIEKPQRRTGECTARKKKTKKQQKLSNLHSCDIQY